MLSRDCNFAAVSAVRQREEGIRDAFIAGIMSNAIRQRLLESENLDLNSVIAKARSLEAEQINADRFGLKCSDLASYNTAAINGASSEEQKFEKSCSEKDPTSVVGVANAKPSTCYFCGNKQHPRKDCPAKECICFKCRKKGHFAKVCQADSREKSAVALMDSTAIMSLTKFESGGNKTSVNIQLNRVPVQALLDTSATNSHVSENIARRLKVNFLESSYCVGLAVKGVSSKTLGTCEASVELMQRKYFNVKFSVLKDLLTDVVLGHDFLDQHESVNIHFGGTEPPLNLRALKPLKAFQPPALFKYLSEDCHLIATKSRRYSSTDK